MYRALFPWMKSFVRRPGLMVKAFKDFQNLVSKAKRFPVKSANKKRNGRWYSNTDWPQFGQNLPSKVCSQFLQCIADVLDASIRFI